MTKSTLNNTRKTIFPLLASLIWGTSFVAQTFNRTGAFTFIALRNFIAFIFTAVIIFLFKKENEKSLLKKDGKFDKNLILGGILCGIALSFASFFQQFGVDSGTESGKAAFITSMYIVFVPLFGLIVKRHTPRIAYLCIFIAVIGLYLLCVKDGFSVRISDIYVLICSTFFAIHILLLDHFTLTCDNLKLANLQFLVAGITSLILSLCLERTNFSEIQASILPILYLGIFSSGIAYTLQIFAQKGANPAVTALLLSTESLFGVISSAIIIGEVLTIREYLGCAIMFVAIIISALPENIFQKKEKNRN